MADEILQQGTLKRGLKNRHIQLIALGGAIGTGLFLGSAGVLKSAGPSMILGYAIAGFIAFLIMRQLGEMIVEEPVAGSFSHFAHNYWGSFAGFLSGWNYWVLYVLVGMAELTAVGKYIQFWWPEVPTWVSAAVFFVLVNLINTLNVKVFGEMEFWFAIIKVVAIIGMIVLGCYMLFSGTGGPQASVSNPLAATRTTSWGRRKRSGTPAFRTSRSCTIAMSIRGLMSFTTAAMDRWSMTLSSSPAQMLLSWGFDFLARMMCYLTHAAT